MLERVLGSPRYQHFGGLYEPGFPLLFRFLFYHERFLERFHPRLLNHFTTIGLVSSIYGTKWFSTVYGQFPLELLLRLWDIFLNEGVKILFRFALYLLGKKEKLLLKCDFEGAVMCLQDLHNEKFLTETSGVIEEVLEVSIKRADFLHMDELFERQHPNHSSSSHAVTDHDHDFNLATTTTTTTTTTTPTTTSAAVSVSASATAATTAGRHEAKGAPLKPSKSKNTGIHTDPTSSSSSSNNPTGLEDTVLARARMRSTVSPTAPEGSRTRAAAHKVPSSQSQLPDRELADTNASSARPPSGGRSNTNRR